MPTLHASTFEPYKTQKPCTLASPEDIKATLFTKQGNLLTHKDGPTLWKKLTLFTALTTTQLSISAFQSILNFDPSSCNFIATINTQLASLFVLTTTPHHTLDPHEHISHILTVYNCIKQPVKWSQWVQLQVDDFEDGAINNPQDFMNCAIMKQNCICKWLGGFTRLLATTQQELVAMVVALKQCCTISLLSSSSAPYNQNAKSVSSTFTTIPNCRSPAKMTMRSLIRLATLRFRKARHGTL